MDPILQRGQVVPTFALPDIQGQIVRRTVYRGMKHLVLIFLPSLGGSAAQEYLDALADSYALVRAACGEVLVIVNHCSSQEVPDQLNLNVPVRVLYDAEGSTTRRFIPIDKQAAVFIIDRYGELYYDLLVNDIKQFPPIAEICDWIEAIDAQCAV